MSARCDDELIKWAILLCQQDKYPASASLKCTEVRTVLLRRVTAGRVQQINNGSELYGGLVLQVEGCNYNLNMALNLRGAFYYK